MVVYPCLMQPKVPVEDAPKRGEGGTPPIEDIRSEKIRGCSYRRQIADVGQRRRIAFLND